MSQKPHRGGTVLLVDDTRSVLEQTRRLLAGHGYDVLIADSPEDALRVFASHPRAIDLLLTDVVMPGMSGRELAERARQLKPDLPTLYMSGDPAGVIEPGDGLPPATSFLAKPFHPKSLLAAVGEALAAQPSR